MGGFEYRVDDDLLGFEIVEIDNGDTGIGLVIDEQIASIILTIGLGDGGVVGITEVDLLALNVALAKYGL